MKKVTLFLIVVICISFFSQKVSAQSTNYVDVVYLKNGSIIKGVIVENTPNKGIKLKTFDGNLFVYTYTEIEKFAKEEVVQKMNNSNAGIVSEKNPGVALLFSFLLPGGGQYYNGEISKGALITGVWLGSIILMYASEDTAIPGLILYSANSIYSLVDAPMSATRINKSHNIGLLNLRIGNDKYLSLSPDVQIARQPIQVGFSKPQATVGLRLSLSL